MKMYHNMVTSHSGGTKWKGKEVTHRSTKSVLKSIDPLFHTEKFERPEKIIVACGGDFISSREITHHSRSIARTMKRKVINSCTYALMGWAGRVLVGARCSLLMAPPSLFALIRLRFRAHSCSSLPCNRRTPYAFASTSVGGPQHRRYWPVVPRGRLLGHRQRGH